MGRQIVTSYRANLISPARAAALEPHWQVIGDLVEIIMDIDEQLTKPPEWARARFRDRIAWYGGLRRKRANALERYEIAVRAMTAAAIAYDRDHAEEVEERRTRKSLLDVMGDRVRAAERRRQAEGPGYVIRRESSIEWGKRVVEYTPYRGERLA